MRTIEHIRSEWSWDGAPPVPGWYATVTCYDPNEGFYPGAQWLGAGPVPGWIVAIKGPFPDEAAASAWAQGHDPDY